MTEYIRKYGHELGHAGSNFSHVTILYYYQVDEKDGEENAEQEAEEEEEEEEEEQQKELEEEAAQQLKDSAQARAEMAQKVHDSITGSLIPDMHRYLTKRDREGDVTLRVPVCRGYLTMVFDTIVEKSLGCQAMPFDPILENGLGVSRGYQAMAFGYH